MFNLRDAPNDEIKKTNINKIELFIDKNISQIQNYKVELEKTLINFSFIIILLFKIPN